MTTEALETLASLTRAGLAPTVARLREAAAAYDAIIARHEREDGEAEDRLQAAWDDLDRALGTTALSEADREAVIVAVYDVLDSDS